MDEIRKQKQNDTTLWDGDWLDGCTNNLKMDYTTIWQLTPSILFIQLTAWLFL